MHDLNYVALGISQPAVDVHMCGMYLGVSHGREKRFLLTTVGVQLRWTVEVEHVCKPAAFAPKDSKDTANSGTVN